MSLGGGDLYLYALSLGCIKIAEECGQIIVVLPSDIEEVNEPISIPYQQEITRDYLLYTLGRLRVTENDYRQYLKNIPNKRGATE